MHKEINELKKGDVIITFLKNDENKLYRKELSVEKIDGDAVISASGLKVKSDYSSLGKHYFKTKRT